MLDSWLGLVDSVLRPSRPDLARCEEEREAHLARRTAVAERRTRAIANCELRIQMARAAVFAADDGVVTSRMTDLEKEWRQLSRTDRDAGLMDLWCRIAPPAWIDRKLWRDSAPAAQLDAAIALAADTAGVEAAEDATRSLRAALQAWGTPIGARIRWRATDHDVDATTNLLTEPLRAACEALASFDAGPLVAERAERAERAVLDAVVAKRPDRPELARSIANAVFVDFLWRAAGIVDRPNPMVALQALLRTGYSIAAIDASGTTLAIP